MSRPVSEKRLLRHDQAALLIQRHSQHGERSRVQKLSQIYTKHLAENLQRIRTQINKSSAIAKIRIWVENGTVKHLKTFRIIFSEIRISFLILCEWYFSCLYTQRFFILWYELKLFFQIFVSKVVFYTGQQFLKIVACEQDI